jgi:hypothetical protein
MTDNLQTCQQTQSLRTTQPNGSLDLPIGENSTRFRSNSCIGLPRTVEEGGGQKDGGLVGGLQLMASNSALDRLQQLGTNGTNGGGPAKDPVVESSLAIRKLSQAFGVFLF